jgi:LPPG:FO 2-phospho-L-lactate transferase
VHRQHSVPVTSIRFDGAESCAPAPGVIEAIQSAELVVIAPSNPLVSIDPVLAVPGVRDAVAAQRHRTVAISPIVAGAALKGPADRLMSELGYSATVVGVSEIYAEVASTLVIDEADAALAEAVEAAGQRCIVAPTIMSSPGAAIALGETVLGAFG